VRRIQLHNLKEANYVLNSLTRWNNNIGEQARRLATWIKKGWLKQSDLFETVNSLLEESVGYGLLSRKDVARLISQDHLTDLVGAVTVYTDENPGEEAVAMYMLTAKERGIDVEKAITLYFDFKEQYQEEQEEWIAKFDFDIVEKVKKIDTKRKKDGTLTINEQRSRIIKNRNKGKLDRQRKFKELAIWIAENELAKPWSEERKQLPGLAKAEFEAATDKPIDKGTKNGEHQT
jgi:hypothetical protein